LQNHDWACVSSLLNSSTVNSVASGFEETDKARRLIPPVLARTPLRGWAGAIVERPADTAVARRVMPDRQSTTVQKTSSQASREWSGCVGDDRAERIGQHARLGLGADRHAQAVGESLPG
jgi:hypothetical protein